MIKVYWLLKECFIYYQENYFYNPDIQASDLIKEAAVPYFIISGLHSFYKYDYSVFI